MTDKYNDMNNTCPGCDDHCDLEKPGCGYGEDYAENLDAAEQTYAETDQPETGVAHEEEEQKRHRYGRRWSDEFDDEFEGRGNGRGGRGRGGRGPHGSHEEGEEHGPCGSHGEGEEHGSCGSHGEGDHEEGHGHHGGRGHDFHDEGEGHGPRGSRGHGPHDEGEGHGPRGGRGRGPHEEPHGPLPEEEYNALDTEGKLNELIRDLGHMSRFGMESKGGQNRILQILAREGDMTQRSLTARLGIQPGSVSELLGKLERAGFITRSANETDRRTTDIHLTESGKEMFDSNDQNSPSLFSELNEDEKSQLLVLLEKLRADWKERLPRERRGGPGRPMPGRPGHPMPDGGPGHGMRGGRGRGMRADEFEYPTRDDDHGGRGRGMGRGRHGH